MLIKSILLLHCDFCPSVIQIELPVRAHNNVVVELTTQLFLLGWTGDIAQNIHCCPLCKVHEGLTCFGKVFKSLGTN